LTSYPFLDRAKDTHLLTPKDCKIASSSSQSNKSNSTTRRDADTSHDAPRKSKSRTQQSFSNSSLLSCTLSSDLLLMRRHWCYDLDTCLRPAVWWKYLTVAGIWLLDTQDSRWLLMAVFSPGISYLNRPVPIESSAVGRNLVPRRSFFWGAKTGNSALIVTPRMHWIWNEYDVSLHHWILSISKYLEWNSFVYNTLPFFRITYILNDLQPRSTTQGSIDVSTSIYQPWITLWSICSRGGWWLVFSEEIGWVRDAHSSLFYSARGGDDDYE